MAISQFIDRFKINNSKRGNHPRSLSFVPFPKISLALSNRISTTLACQKCTHKYL